MDDSGGDNGMKAIGIDLYMGMYMTPLFRGIGFIRTGELCSMCGVAFSE